MKILFILLLITCSSYQEKQIEIKEPPKLEPIIKEVKENVELKKNPLFQKRISNALETCQKYNNEILANLKNCIDNSNRQSKIIDEYKKQITKLEEELLTWRKLKYTTFTIIGLVIISILLWFLYPIIIKLIRGV